MIQVIILICASSMPREMCQPNTASAVYDLEAVSSNAACQQSALLFLASDAEHLWPAGTTLRVICLREGLSPVPGNAG